MFVDEAVVSVCGGRGGAGAVSFLRERNRPFGGPDGGDGGRGGDVVGIADARIATLADYRIRPLVRAGDGGRGAGRRRHGADGRDETMPLPVGAMIRDDDTGALHADFVSAGQKSILAKGGGRRSATPLQIVDSPRAAHRPPGLPGEARRFRIELRLVADVGIVGKPTRENRPCSRRSRARAQNRRVSFHHAVAAIGNRRRRGRSGFRRADIPGVIEGAAQGAGLGNRFCAYRARFAFAAFGRLRISRRRSRARVANRRGRYRIIRGRIARLAARRFNRTPRWLALSKTDLQPAALVAALVARARETRPQNPRVRDFRRKQKRGGKLVRDAGAAVEQQRARAA